MAHYLLIKESTLSDSVEEQLKHQKKFEEKIGKITGTPITFTLIYDHQLRTHKIYNLFDLLHRLKAGDMLGICSVFHIGSTYQKILEVITKYHDARVQLVIFDISYYDQVPPTGSPKSKNSDYELLSSFLKKFKYLRKHQKEHSSKKRGRHPITWDDIPSDIQEIILYHSYHRKTYSANECLADIYAFNFSIGINKLNELRKEAQNRVPPTMYKKQYYNHTRPYLNEEQLKRREEYYNG